MHLQVLLHEDVDVRRCCQLVHLDHRLHVDHLQQGRWHTPGHRHPWNSGTHPRRTPDQDVIVQVPSQVALPSRPNWLGHSSACLSCLLLFLCPCHPLSSTSNILAVARTWSSPNTERCSNAWHPCHPSGRLLLNDSRLTCVQICRTCRSWFCWDCYLSPDGGDLPLVFLPLPLLTAPMSIESGSFLGLKVVGEVPMRKLKTVSKDFKTKIQSCSVRPA